MSYSVTLIDTEGNETTFECGEDEYILDKNAIIPLKFNIKMDGISGIIPFNTFRIAPDKLPVGY